MQFIEIYTFAKPRPYSEIVSLLPKPVSIDDPVVRLRVDMSNPDVSEYRVPAHFTNIQQGLQLARRYLVGPGHAQPPGDPDHRRPAHGPLRGQVSLPALSAAIRATEEATLREGHLCQREGITINIFLLPNWAQSHEDVQFAYRLAESTRGRVFFTAGKELDRYVLWDYLKRRREIVA